MTRKLKIGYLGPQATFSHQAAVEKFNGECEYEALKSIPKIFAKVKAGLVDFGVVPIENTIGGPVSMTYDAFIAEGTHIFDEVYLPIQQHLIGQGPMENIRRVISHPQALAQCQPWLQENLPDVDIVESVSTVSGVIAAKEDPAIAALSGRFAAEYYEVGILAAEIQDCVRNTTRFLIIGLADAEYQTQLSGRCRTSLMYSVKHASGGLVSSLLPIFKADLNMLAIESRPSRDKNWEYIFFIDVEGDENDSALHQAIEQIKTKCYWLKVLGTYPSRL